MQPLIDSDILLYEIGFSSQQVIDGEVVPNSWEFVEDLVTKKIESICYEAEATEEPILFMTNTRRINKSLNKQRKVMGEKPKEFVPNFREEVAKTKEYKGGRKSEKPFHYRNLQEHFLANYKCIVNEEGLEADDQMCILQYEGWKKGESNTIICSRDKDLRQCPGWHYSWEVGKQASIGPLLVDELGHLEKKTANKVFGTGDKFFYYQLVVGDGVDNIQGLKGRGPAFGYKLLWDAESSRECYELVAELYIKEYGDDWKKNFREMADLLWMVREVDEKGEKIKWRPPAK